MVGVVREALFAPGEGRALLARLAAPATRIVTLTVTEKGYGHNPATGDLDLDHPDIRADLAGRDPPRSTLGWLVRGLARAEGGGRGGLTVLCCDNMAENGRTLRRLVRQFAQTRRSGARRLDRGRGPLPEQHGRPDRPGRHAGLARPGRGRSSACATRRPSPPRASASG